MPDLDSESLYSALLAKDTRFDGRFFVGVATTGVYCRPVCQARKPLAVNCSFYATAAEAEQAGFRPCLLCRPELAPGYAPVDSSASLACAVSSRTLITCVPWSTARPADFCWPRVF